MPTELRPIFRDVTDLQLGELSTIIRNAIEASRFLIVICSKNTPHSKYVNDEVSYFLELNDASFVIPFIIDGTPNSINSDDECFPDALLRIGIDILAANVNEYSKDYAAVKVVSRLLGGLEIHRLWDRYQAAEEEERKRLIETNKRLRSLSARASTISARTLVTDGNKAIAAKIALLNLPHKDDIVPIIPEAEYLLRMSTMEDEREMYSLFSFGMGQVFNDYRISSNGQYFILQSGFTFWLFDCTTGHIIHSGSGYFPNEFDTLLFSDDQSLLLSSDCQNFEIFDIPNKKVIAQFSIKDRFADIGIGNRVRFNNNESLIITTNKNVLLEYNIKNRVLRDIIRIDEGSIDNWCVNDDKIYLLGVRPINSSVYIEDVMADMAFPISTIDLRNNQFDERDYAIIWTVSPSKQVMLSSVEGYIRLLDRDFNLIFKIDSLDLGWSGDLSYDSKNIVASVSDAGNAVMVNKASGFGFILTKFEEPYCISNVKDFVFSKQGQKALYYTNTNKVYLISFINSKIEEQLVYSSEHTIKDILFSDNDQIFLVLEKGVCSMFDCKTFQIISTKTTESDAKLYSTNIPHRFININGHATISVVEWNSIFQSFNSKEERIRDDHSLHMPNHSGHMIAAPSEINTPTNEIRRYLCCYENSDKKTLYYLLDSNGEPISQPQEHEKTPNCLVIMSSNKSGNSIRSASIMAKYKLLPKSKGFFKYAYFQENEFLFVSTVSGIVLYNLDTLKAIECSNNIDIEGLTKMAMLDDNTIVAVYHSNVIIFDWEHDIKRTYQKIDKSSYYDVSLYYDDTLYINDGRFLIKCSDGAHELFVFKDGILNNHIHIRKGSSSIPLTLIKGLDAYYQDGKVYGFDGVLLFQCEKPVEEKAESSYATAIAPPGKDFIIYDISYDHCCKNYLRVWSLNNGRLIYEADYKQFMTGEIEFDTDNNLLRWGDNYFIPFPPLDELIKDTEKRIGSIELSDETKSNFFLQ